MRIGYVIVVYFLIAILNIALSLAVLGAAVWLVVFILRSMGVI